MAVRGSVCVILVALLGCASTYRPRSSARVAIVSNGWSTSYVRDGREIPQGFLFAGVEEAVRGNPRAEGVARTAHGRAVGGFLATLGGLICAEIGLIVMLHDAQNDETPSDTVKWATIGCAVASAVGIGYLSSGVAMHWDAINIYNDGIVEQAAVAAEVPWTLGARIFPTDGQSYAVVGYWLFPGTIRITSGAELKRAIELSPAGAVQGTILAGDDATRAATLPVVLGRTYTVCVQARPEGRHDALDSPVACKQLTVSNEGELTMSVLVPYPAP